MFSRTVLAGAVVLVALMSAAPASASPDPVVAAAINPQTGVADIAYGSGEPIGYTIQDAIEACNQAHGPGCVYAGAIADGCVGIAFGYPGHFRWALDPTIPGAEQAAKSKLTADGPTASNGNPVLSAACADGTSDGFSAGE